MVGSYIDPLRCFLREIRKNMIEYSSLPFQRQNKGTKFLL